MAFDACGNVFGKDRDPFRWGGYGEEETCPALPHSDATLGDTVVSKSENSQTYIIHMDHTHKPESFLTHESWHHAILKSLSSSPADDKELLLYSYNHVMHGFSARLTPSQLSEIEESISHLATYPESFVKPMTTYSPKFLGLQENFGIWPAASYGEDVIVGVVDSGVWPESESFDDKDFLKEGMEVGLEIGIGLGIELGMETGIGSAELAAVGKSESGMEACIGSAELSAGGMEEVGMELGMEACKGSTGLVAVGVGEKVDKSKVVWESELGKTDVESRIGVVIGKLIGARFYYKGILAQGSNAFEKGEFAQDFNASEEGEFLSPRDFCGHGTHAASTTVGNHVPGVSYFGYARGTAIGVAPRARLAVYKVLWLDGHGVASDVLAGMEQAILDGVDIMSLSLGFNNGSYFTDLVALGSFSAIEKGIFVVCAAGNDFQFKTVDNVAPWITTVGAGTLDRNFHAKMNLKNGVSNEGTSYFPESVFITDLPLYYGKDNVSKAICKDKTLDRKEVAGKVAICDGSRLNVSQQIKEVERVGAYAAIFTDIPLSYDKYIISNNEYSIPSLILPTGSGTLVKDRICTPEAHQSGNYDLVTNYKLMSGSSMATPHVAGVGALLKAVHPEWSPAAIRSAMMTTAYAMDNTGTILKSEHTKDFGSPIEFGAGHINPNKAMDTGLIYDMGFQDYIEFLCGVEHTKKQMSALIMVVTNVGNDKAVYRAHLENIPTGLKISVKPRTLTFTRKYQTRSFVVNIELDREFSKVIYGFLKWIDQDSHIVSSSIVAINF
nr:subtilisin-like protease sbt1.9 [Quercus suber]